MIRLSITLLSRKNHSLRKVTNRSTGAVLKHGEGTWLVENDEKFIITRIAKVSSLDLHLDSKLSGHSRSLVSLKTNVFTKLHTHHATTVLVPLRVRQVAVITAGNIKQFLFGGRAEQTTLVVPENRHTRDFSKRIRNSVIGLRTSMTDISIHAVRDQREFDAIRNKSLSRTRSEVTNGFDVLLKFRVREGLNGREGIGDHRGDVVDKDFGSLVERGGHCRDGVTRRGMTQHTVSELHPSKREIKLVDIHHTFIFVLSREEG